MSAQPDLRQAFSDRMGSMLADEVFRSSVLEQRAQALEAQLNQASATAAETEEELRIANDTIVDLTAQLERAREVPAAE